MVTITPFSWIFLIIILVEFECPMRALYRCDRKAIGSLRFRVSDASLLQTIADENPSHQPQSSRL